MNLLQWLERKIYEHFFKPKILLTFNSNMTPNQSIKFKIKYFSDVQPRASNSCRNEKRGKKIRYVESI